MSAALTLAPVSSKAAELLHALYAETLAAAEASLQVPPAGAIVLQAAPTIGMRGEHYETNGYRSLRANSANWDYRIRLQTPLIADPKYVWHRPGIWYGTEERSDMDGRRWESSLPNHYTTDDFGDLVEVPRW
jgi:hypothetical protein